MNFFFDTLLFCGAILLLANSIERTSGGADLVLDHPLDAQTVARAMAPGSVAQNNPTGKARRTVR